MWWKFHNFWPIIAICTSIIVEAIFLDFDVENLLSIELFVRWVGFHLIYSYNSDGISLLDVAILTNNNEMVKTLISFGAREGGQCTYILVVYSIS